MKTIQQPSFGWAASLTLVALYAWAGQATAQSPMPQVQGASCPSGYRSSSGMCVPTSSAKPGYVKPQGKSCASGYRSSSHYCIKT